MKIQNAEAPKNKEEGIKTEKLTESNRFQLRSNSTPTGVVLSSFATREEADKALAATKAKISEPISTGELPVVVDMGVPPVETVNTKVIEAGKTAEEKAAEKVS